MCVNTFLKQRCVAFEVRDCDVGGNSTLKSRVLTDRAGTVFVQGCLQRAAVKNARDLDQREAKSPKKCGLSPS